MVEIKLKAPMFASLFFFGIIALYFMYVLLFSRRIKDGMEIKIEGGASNEILQHGRAYRISSLNVGFGAYSADFTFFMDGGKESRARSQDSIERNIRGCVSQVSELGTDFMLFQEIDTHGTRSLYVNELDLIEKILLPLDDASTSAWGPCSFAFALNYDSPYLMYPLKNPHGKNKSGILTVSQFKMDSCVRRSLPIEKGFSKLFDLDRCYSKALLPVQGGKSLALYNVHFSAYTSHEEVARKQVQMLAEDMEREFKAGRYAVAGGDMNKEVLKDAASLFGKTSEGQQWCKPFPEELLPECLSLISPCAEESPVPTTRNTDIPYCEESFVTAIDGFLVSRNVKVLDTSVVDAGFEFSDHNPIYMDFMLLP